MFQTPTKTTTSSNDPKHNVLFDCLTDRVPLPQEAHDVDQPCKSPKPFALCSVIHNVLTAQECQRIIARAEHKSFEPALLNIGGGRQVYAPDARNSERTIIDDTNFATCIWSRIRHLLPTNHNLNKTTYPVAGLNERLRILRYGPGHDFKPHCDGSYFRPDGSQGSFWTVMIYLNNGESGNDFEGGATLFHACDGKETVTVVPRAGSILIFDHDLFHEGQKVKSGTKYALRTDVMFHTNNSPNQKTSESTLLPALSLGHIADLLSSTTLTEIQTTMLQRDFVAFKKPTKS